MGRVEWQKYLHQRMAKSVSDLFLIGEECVGWMPLKCVFVPVLDVATGFEKMFSSIQEGWNQADMWE